MKNKIFNLVDELIATRKEEAGKEFALDEVDFKKHSGVISYFNREYVSTNIFQEN